MKKVLFLALVPVEIILLFFLEYYIAIFVDINIVQSHIFPSIRVIDKNIASLIYNGLICALIAFVMIAVLGVIIKRPLKDFGFNLKNFKFSIRANFKFLLIFMTLYIVFGTLAAMYNLFSYAFSFPLNILNYTTFLLFELFISGLEEIYFRSFVISILLILWRPIFKCKKTLEITAVIASTIVFVLRHIGMTFTPFTITYLVPLQLLVVAVMGLYLGYIFVKTNSILGSYFAHGFSNFFIFIFLLGLNLVL